MSIRKNTNPHPFDLHPELQQLLMRNGMQAHLSVNQSGDMQLIVLGHDSPVITYNINGQQAEAMMDGGTGSSNKKAYNTFARIVKKDFDIPQAYVTAQNAMGRVALGLHGYRLNRGEYGIPRHGGRYPGMIGWGGDFVAWAPRTPHGYHLRRIGDRAFYQDMPWVAERPDGRMKPGELKSGAYGFYYKGGQQQGRDMLEDMEVQFKEEIPKAAERPEGKGIPYSEQISSSTYFSKEAFLEVMKSHGIIISEEKKMMMIQSSNTKVDVKYDLSDRELRDLLNNSVSGDGSVSLQKRLDIINAVIAKDFAEPITKEMLEGKNLISISFKPEAREELEKKFIEYERRVAEQQRMAEQQRELERNMQAERQRIEEENEKIRQNPDAVNGRELAAIIPGMAWYAGQAHGRMAVVGEIKVVKTSDTGHVMMAKINGEWHAHSISEKDYNRFLAIDDEHRLKMFDKYFDEVKIRKAGRDMTDRDVVTTRDGHTVIRQEQLDIDNARRNHVDGRMLEAMNDGKGFYREERHGRPVEVGNIEVNRLKEGKYSMTAVIDGKTVNKEITQKDYDKFLAVDDYHRMKLFAKIFDDVEIKNKPGERGNVGQSILNALLCLSGVAAGVEMARHHSRPEIYESHVAMTQGDLSALTAANYEAGQSRQEGEQHHYNRGM